MEYHDIYNLLSNSLGNKNVCVCILLIIYTLRLVSYILQKYLLIDMNFKNDYQNS